MNFVLQIYIHGTIDVNLIFYYDWMINSPLNPSTTAILSALLHFLGNCRNKFLLLASQSLFQLIKFLYNITYLFSESLSLFILCLVKPLVI
jgi:hypothetical protein